MSVVNSIPLIAAGDDGYKISRSVRLRSSASAYFNQTPASVGNRRTWTWSAWVKRGIIGNGSLAFAGTLNATTSIYILFTGEVIAVYGYNTSTLNVTWNVYLRDPSAWYHIVVAFDTTQATASNRVKLYINNQQITGTITATYPGINTDWDMGNNTAQYLGRRSDGSYSLDTYLTEINYINGQQLTPSSFGETNAVTGVWQPKKYTGTYGTNGYYLNFSDNSNNTAATIGKDNSGNGNNWTPNNISVTAGATYDSMIDVPTPYADGGNGRGNYAVLNPLRQNGSATFAQGNLAGTSESGTSRGLCSTIVLPRTDNWYMEWTPSSSTTNWFGVTANQILAADINTAGQQSVLYYANGTKWVNGSNSSYGASYTTQTIGVAFDGPAGTITFYRDNVSQGAITLPSSTVDYVFCMGNAGGGGVTNHANFGQRPFAYTPPTGFKALNTQNLPTPTISNGASYFNTVLYTGNAVQDRAITGFGFDLDLAWIKSRNNVTSHVLVNSVVGGDKQLFSNLTNAEQTYSDITNGFTTGGILVGDNVTGTGSTNQNTYTYALWGWNAGGSTVTNTSGSISAQVRANPTAGFSVVTYTGTGSAATVGHGLGVAPSMIIVKNRNTASYGWFVWHTAFGAAGNTDYINLNLTDAKGSGGAVSMWNTTMPTSSVFSLGTYAGVNGNTNTYVAYLFAAVAGYSAFGSYTGNGSADGPFVYLGFRPRWVMFKKSSAAEDWVIFDTTRNASNLTNLQLYPNLSSAEATGVTGVVDILSNGIKIRGTSDALNTSSGTYIYAAFAENPFKLSLAR